MFRNGIKYLSKHLFLLFAAVAVLPLATASAADPYYRGKTLSLIVGFGAGGPVDLLARLVAPYVSKHTPGNPTVIVKNKPSAGSIQAHNYIYEIAKPDGEELFFGPWFPVHQILGARGVRFKYQGYTKIAALKSAGFVMYGRSDMVPGGVKKPGDLLKATDIRFGASNPYNTFDLHGRLALEALGVKYRHVTGYRGSATIRPAVLRNEVNIAVDSIASYHNAVVPTIIKTGVGVPLWVYPALDKSGNYVRDPDLPDVPTYIEFYREALGKNPSGERWELLKFVMSLSNSGNSLVLGPPKMNKAAAAPISEGFYKALNDSEFLKQSRKRFGYEPQSVDLPGVVKMMRIIDTVDPKTVAALRKHIESSPSGKGKRRK